VSGRAARCAAGAGAALALLASACGSGAARHATTSPGPFLGATQVTYHGRRVQGGAVATDFALRDQHGRMVQLSALRGRIVVLTFLYTHCVDVCPLIAGNIDRAVRSLGPRGREVVVVAVSVDPDHDTPGAVSRFVAEHRLSPNFHYLTGPLDELRPIWQAYNLLIEPGSAGRVAHSAYILVLNRAGRPRIYYPPLVTEPVLARDLAAMVHRRGRV
jgi:protein SCO1/2